MSTDQDDGHPDRDQIKIDALFAAQQADRRRQRTRVALVTVAALTAGGVTGGIAVGVIGGEDGGTQQAAGSASPSAEPAAPDQDDGGRGSSGQEDDPAGADQRGSAAQGSGQQGTDASPNSDVDPSDLPSQGPTGIPSPSPQEPGAGGATGSSTDGTSSPGQTPPESAPQSPAAPDQPAQHVVQYGESLWEITAGVLGEGASAQQVLDSWPKLYEANRDLIGNDPDVLFAGQELVVPALG